LHEKFSVDCAREGLFSRLFSAWGAFIFVIGVHGRIYAGMPSVLIWTKFVPNMGLWHPFWGCLQTETNTSVPSNIHIQTCSKLMKQKKCYEKTKCLSLKYPHGFFGTLPRFDFPSWLHTWSFALPRLTLHTHMILWSRI